ncbi:hypothetical protein F4804DRAFT_297564 [Jackrogersella minutella]|nr:hypothetical protein F4804DRAFT_297564 [Jackrogersella minutella]
MALLPTVILPILIFTRPCHAQQEVDEVSVPANFPKAFITAMAVAIICVVIVLTLVCVLAHCWQYILGYRWRGKTSSLRTPERWVDPVFEWPQQLMPRSRNNRKRKRRGQRGRDMRREIKTFAAGYGRRRSREVMLRGWL